MSEKIKIDDFQENFVSNSSKILSIKNLENKYKNPCDLELEACVLGCLIVNSEIFDTVFSFLKKENFFSESHRNICNAIINLNLNSEKIDLLTVINQLRKEGNLESVGGAHYIVLITSNIGAFSNIENYCKILVEMSMRRDLISNCISIQRECYDYTKDIFDLVDSAEKSIFEITSSNIKENYKNINSIVSENLKKIQTSHQNKGSITGISTGFNLLDKVTCGWQKSDLIIIAARPGMGKTSFALSMIQNSLKKKEIAVGFFSLEMSSEQLVYRMISAESEIENRSLKNGNLEKYEWQKVMSISSKLSKSKIYIDDTPSLSIFELKTKCRRLKSKHNIEMLVIDYLQLMVGDVSKKNFNREQEIASISRTLKNIAKELNIVVVALSQLSRAVESRGGTKKPQLSDLRESGAIEQDADMVILLYRPEYYGITEDENGNSTEGKAELIIAKNRNGALQNIQIEYLNKFTKFSDLQEDLVHYKIGEKKNIIKSSKINDLEDF